MYNGTSTHEFNSSHFGDGQPCDYDCGFINNLKCSKGVCNCSIIYDLRVSTSGEMMCEFIPTKLKRECDEGCGDDQFCNKYKDCQCKEPKIMISGEGGCVDVVHEMPMKRCHLLNKTAHVCDLKQHSYCKNRFCICFEDRYYNMTTKACELKKNSSRYNGYAYRAIPEEYCVQKSDCIEGLSCRSNFTCSCPHSCIYKKGRGICDCGKVEFETPRRVLWTGGILGFVSVLFWLGLIRKTYLYRPKKPVEFTDIQEDVTQGQDNAMMSHHPHTEELDEWKGGLREENESTSYPQNDQNVNPAYPPSMPTPYPPWKSNLGTPSQLPYPSSATPNHPPPPYSTSDQDFPEVPNSASTQNQLPYPTSVPPSGPSCLAPSGSTASPIVNFPPDPVSSQPSFSLANVTPYPVSPVGPRQVTSTDLINPFSLTNVTPYPVSPVGPGQVTFTALTNPIPPNSAANISSLPETNVPSDPLSQRSVPSSNVNPYPLAPPVTDPYPVTSADSTNPYQPTAPNLAFLNSTPSGPYPI